MTLLKSGKILLDFPVWRKLPPTWCLALLGHDVVIFISSNMAAVVRAGQTSVSILSYLVHQQRISSGSGRTIFKFHHIAKP
jgi:hypothetical protein